MKKIFIIGGTILFILSLYIIVARTTNEHPTREEWLEVYTTHKIKELTDSWKQLVAVRVTIVPKDQEIVITLTSANGQEEISQSDKNGYVDIIATIVKSILEKYDWIKHYKLTVQYI